MQQSLISAGLTTIRNAQKTGKRMAVMPTNKLMNAVLEILKRKGYIDSYEVSLHDKKYTVRVTLKYNEDGDSVIREIGLLSKSSLRSYYRADKIPRLKNGFATVIISTSRGVMIGKEAREQRLGGEPICYVF